LFVCLADKLVAVAGLYGDDAEVVTIDRLSIPDFAGFTFRYDVMELNTAAKPFMFLYLLEERNYERVLYFDPDIEIFAKLSAVMDPLAAGAAFVLTPHVLAPSEGQDEPNDLSFLRAGIYNLGFLGASATPETLDALRWWSRRLLYQCVNDQPGGLFVDQKFADLLPAFVSNVVILRDAALNVAYWNLSQRALVRTQDGWTVDGHALGFFHYSGFDPRSRGRLSKHTRLFADVGGTPLGDLLDDYAARLTAHGHGIVARGTYAYGKFASGTPVPDIVRRMYRERHAGWPRDPFETFEAQLHRPWPGAQGGSASFVVTYLMAYLHSTMPYLRGCMDITTLDGQVRLVDWFIKHAARDLGLDSRLVEPSSLRAGDRLPPPPGPRAGNGSPMDVSVVGYLRTTSGVGEVARANLAALAQAGMRVEGCDVSLGVAADRSVHAANDLLSDRPTGRVRLFNINADQLPLVLEHMRPVLDDDAYQIAMPFWELAEFPDAWLAAFDPIDEVWAPSRWIQLMLARKLDKPVLYMPRALGPQRVSAARRSAFGLPDRRFLFFFAFDFLSFAERKNPAGVIEAFHRACQMPGAGRPGLVIKALNGDLAPDRLALLREQIEQDPDIFLIERILSRPDMAALVSVCDAVVSLHRAEGFGLLVAEAMQLGRPVIATDYAATTELVSPSTGFPVEYRLIPVAEGAYPFGEGQVWADPDLDHAGWLMARLAAEPALGSPLVAAATAHLERHYSPAHAAGRQRERLRELGLVA
jgi:glycosyltransferase involved in cell wall biosynthesis